MKPFSQRHPIFYGLLYRSYRRFPGGNPQGWTSRLTPAGWMMLILLGSTSLLGIDLARSHIHQAFAVVLGICFVSWLSMLITRPRLRARRELPTFVSAGTECTYRVEVENLRRTHQTQLTLRERLSNPTPTREAFLNLAEPGENQRNIFDRVFVFYRWMWLKNRLRLASPRESEPFDLGGQESGWVELTLAPRRRGVLPLNQLEVLRPDVFGFLKACRRVVAPVDSLVVLPKRYQLPELQLEGEAEYQPGGVALANSIGQAEEFIGLREYRAGDPPRQLHYKSWARTGKPIIKETVDEYLPRYAVVLDTFADHDPAGEFEAAVSIAASYAVKLDTRESLLDLMFIGPEAYCFTSGRGTCQAEKLLEILAGVQLCRQRPFEDLLPIVRERAGAMSACICILIRWDAGREKFIEALRKQGLPIKVFILCAQIPDEPPPGIHFIRLGNVQEDLATC